MNRVENIVELPQYSKILKTEEINQIINNKGQLINYLSKYHQGNNEDIKIELNEIENEFKKMELKFNELDQDKVRVQLEIDDLEEEENKFLQDYKEYKKNIYNKYSNEYLKSEMDRLLRQKNESIERGIKEDIIKGDKIDVDNVIEKYINDKVEYYVRAEKLATWQEQGNLRI